MKIIIGLGNPGIRYRNTRHNAGFMVIKTLAKKHGLSVRKKGFGGIYGIGRILREEVLLFEPMTYMNLSGDAVSAACSSKLENIEDLLIISDDFNLSIGKIRIREKGSAGGHNGLKSITEKIGPDFARLRIGVGNGKVFEDMSSFVLAPFPRREKILFNQTIEENVIGCVETWLKEGTEKAMALYN